jgi:hypothetical protein
MSSAVVVASPAGQELQHQATEWTELAKSTVVVDALSYEIAATHLQAIKALQAEADETFDPIIKRAHETHKEALAQKKHITDPLTQAEAVLKRSMASYVQDQERKRLEEERRLREQAELEAAQAREAEIEEAEAHGATVEEVQAIAQSPLRVSPVITAPVTTRVQGIISREVWKAEVTNLIALVKFVSANPQFISLIQPNTAAINGLARSLRSTMNIPGVRVWSEANIAAGAGRRG